MFAFFQAFITIVTALSPVDLAKALSSVLSIPPLKLDTSGRYEGDKVYVTTCFGLEFELLKDDPPMATYHLVVSSNVDDFDLDGSQPRIDGTAYVLKLLKRGGIDAAPRDPKLLYHD